MGESCVYQAETSIHCSDNSLGPALMIIFIMEDYFIMEDSYKSAVYFIYS